MYRASRPPIECAIMMIGSRGRLRISSCRRIVSLSCRARVTMPAVGCTRGMISGCPRSAIARSIPPLKYETFHLPIWKFPRPNNPWCRTTGSMLGLKRLTDTLDQGVVFGAAAGEVEEAGGQVPVSQCRGNVAVILQNGGAELVIVRVIALEENHSPRRVHQIIDVLLLIKIRQRLAAGGKPIAADLREDFLNRARALCFRVSRLDSIDF